MPIPSSKSEKEWNEENERERKYTLTDHTKDYAASNRQSTDANQTSWISFISKQALCFTEFCLRLPIHSSILSLTMFFYAFLCCTAMWNALMFSICSHVKITTGQKKISASLGYTAAQNILFLPVGFDVCGYNKGKHTGTWNLTPELYLCTLHTAWLL